MEVVTLKCGAAVVAHKDQTWLLDAPKGVGAELDELGIVPNAILLTRTVAPGLRQLPEGLKVLRQIPLRGDGLEAEAHQRPHGWDYVVKDDSGASVLFSQRGDVSGDDVQGHDLAVIGNKYRANSFDESVLTRPWPAQSFYVSAKIYSSLSEAPDRLKELDGAKLTISQINGIVRQAEGIPEDSVEKPWAVAISHFKETHHKEGDKWVASKEEESEKQRGLGGGGMARGEGVAPAVETCVCPNCGNRDPHQAGRPCNEQNCSECGTPMMADRRRSGGTVGHAASRSMVSGLAAGVKAEQGGKYFKTEDGKKFPASDYLVVEDPEKPTTWHLRFTKEPSGAPDRSMMGAAAAALTAPGGHRGNKYQGPGREAAIGKLRGLYRRLDIDKEDWPAGLRSKSFDAALTILQGFHPNANPVDEDVLAVFKDDDAGCWRWASITSATMWDKQDELVTRKAMDYALAYAQLTGQRGPLRHEHIPGLDVGECDWQMRKGGFLFESGFFYDNPFAQQCRKTYQQNPDYQISAGLRYRLGDIEDGVYKRMVIFERSVTKTPAVPLTALGVRKHMIQVTDEMLKQVADELQWPIEELRTMVDQTMKSDNPPGDLESLKSQLVENQTNGAIDQLLENLPEAHKAALFQKLAAGREPVSTEAPATDGDADKTNYATLKATIEGLAAQQAETNKAILALAEALKGGGATQNVQEALEQFMAQLPRKEAAQFMVDKSGGASDGPTLQTIQSQLNEMAKKLEQGAAGAPASFDYNAFTSQRLNRGRG